MTDLTTGRLYEDGRHYDLKYQEYVDDIPFYVAQADRFGGPVLEMFAGTGRISLPIAEAGHELIADSVDGEHIHFTIRRGGS